ncbi:MAG: hypothetical protein LQ347_003507 [Umbilicaria vellea]|nr:MAG: hypothetical protein LQ347_003507 [Umbilicaria vellea]
MAPSKVAGESEELSAFLVATGPAPCHRSRMDTEQFGQLSLLDASTGTAPAPTPRKSRRRRPPQSYVAESQALSTLRPEEITSTTLPGPTESATIVQTPILGQDNRTTSPQTSLRQPSGGGVYLPKPDRVGTIVLNPAVPAYQPLGSSITGNAQVSRYGSGLAFTSYQLVRYTSTARAKPSIVQSREAVSSLNGRWIVSPPRASVGPRDPSSSLDPSISRERSITPIRDLKIHLPAPVPTAQYIAQASRPSTRLQRPQSLLLILDLNGTLLVRRRASRSYTPRPSLGKFLRYCFKHHSVLIWSSATPTNVTSICRKVFSKEQRRNLLGEWGRNTLGLTSTEYNGHVQVYKRLDRVWDSEALSSMHPDSKKGVKWDQRNTILIDDSALKASAQPHNLVHIPEFTKDKADSCDVLRQIVAYLEELRMFEDVSNFIKQTPFRPDEDGATARSWRSWLGHIDQGAMKQQIALESS